MKIKTLKLENWKGITGTTELAAVNLIIGPNMSGKSARLEAIRTAFLGYDPRLGKRGQDVFRYASGKDMSVAVELDNGTSIARRWRQDAKGRITTEINSELANAPASPVLLDPDLYFGLTEGERVKAVFDMVKLAPEEQPAAMLLAKLKKIPVSEEMRQKLASVTALAKDANTQEGLENFIELLTAMRKEADSQAKASQSTAGYVAQEVEVVDEAALERTYAAAKTQAEKFIVEITETRNRILQGQKEQAERQAAEQVVNGSADVDKRISEVTAQMTALKTDAVDPMRLHHLTANLREDQATLARLMQERDDMATKHTALTEEVETVLKGTCCPTCGSDDGTWRRKYKQRTNGELDALEAAMLAKDKELAKIRQRAAAIQVEIAEHNANAQKAQANTAKLGELGAQLNQLTRQRDGLEAAQRIVNAAPKYDLVLEVTRKDELESQLAEVRVRLAEIEGRVRAAAAAKGQQAMRLKAKTDAENAKATAALLKDALAAASEVKSALVEATFGRVLATANRLAKPLLNKTLAYSEGEIGYWKDKQWVSFKTLSGSEQAICYAAVSLALASDSDCKVVMLDECGRLEDTRKAELLKVIRSLVADGTIDQAVLVDVTSAGWCSEIVKGINVILIDEKGGAR